MKDTIKTYLNEAKHDSPEARAELLRDLIRDVYDFVKFDRPEGGGLDGRNGPERESLGLIVDAAEDHYFNMLKLKHG